MISQNDVKELKRQLEEDKARLQEEIKELETPTDFGDAPDGGDEESDEDEELENRGGVAEALRRRVSDIEVALAKIELGKYGLCDNCGGEIPLEVLRAAPESKLCKNCKAA